MGQFCYSFFLPLDGNETVHSHGILEYIPKIELEIIVKVTVSTATIDPKSTEGVPLPSMRFLLTTSEVENFSTGPFVTFPNIKCRTFFEICIKQFSKFAPWVT